MPRVTLVPTGQAFLVEDGETVLAAALRAGLNLPHSCKGGHCASCRARILEGTVDYAGEVPPGITPGEVREGYALLCQARALTDLRVETREVRPAPDVEVKSLPCRIERLDRLAEDVIAVVLRLPAVEEMHFRPGQYIDVMLSEGRRRSFSIASAPADGRHLELHVRRASKSGFTGQLFDSLRTGALLRIEGPLGQFWFRPESPRPPLMVGGGTGYAPLRAMLRQLIATGDRRPVTLYWGARETAGLYEHEWLSGLVASRPGFVFRPVLSGPSLGEDGLRHGLVHEAVLADHADLSGHDVYASGPPAMIEAIRTRFVEHGLPRGQLFFDSFDYAPDTLARMKARQGSG
ncbi:MAG: 2Fe-2S iron-sulfur cluster binding domain-containing protein [Gammaproteobacteria bacterium]|nr:2Fe-2S iron-sulfur cluster binding domain-containing protein [Gammaproteobacteria bacterium]